MPLHVIQRGNNRGDCFFAVRDYTAYLGMLQELAAEHGCAVHAYVLMTNHVHLLLTPQRADSAALLMKNLGQRYVQLVNRRHGRSGSLWEGRFRSCIVDSDQYLLRCYRYIEMNPVRASMVGDPAQYPWSSFHANALGLPSPLITLHAQFNALGRDADARRDAYRALFAEPLTDPELRQIRAATNGGFALGSAAFVEDLAERLGLAVVRRNHRKNRGQTTLSAFGK
jgi:putative transposase